MKLITLVDSVQVGRQPTQTKDLTAIANQSQQMQKESQYACNHNMAKCRACVCDTRVYYKGPTVQVLIFVASFTYIYKLGQMGPRVQAICNEARELLVRI